LTGDCGFVSSSAVTVFSRFALRLRVESPEGSRERQGDYMETSALTFFAWTDTHFGYHPKTAADRCSTFGQMTHLPGQPYPPELGGKVDRPEFVLHCGDIVDAEESGEDSLRCYLQCIHQSDLDTFETLGNHDIVHSNVVQYYTQKYGNLYYSFERGGIHFISFYQTFNENESVRKIDDEQLKWLEQQLSIIGPRKPVILFSHSSLDYLPNADDLDRILRRANVILMLSGHHHCRPLGYDWKGRTGISIGHCRDHPIDAAFARRIVVVRISSNRLAAASRRWDLHQWDRLQGEKVEYPQFIVKDI